MQCKRVKKTQVLVSLSMYCKQLNAYNVPKVL